MDDVFTQAIAESVAEMRGLLKSSDPRDKVWAARTLSSMDANYKRVKLMEARTNAYIERCHVLNDRTAASPLPSQSRKPQDASRKPSPKPFGEPLSPGDIDPRTGRIVPEEHELTLPHLTKETEHIGMCMMPGHKTKADYIRAFHAFYRREDRFHSELRAAKSELNVFRSERLGSITLEKREELLAGRYEKNAKRREMYDVPDFVKHFGPDTPPDVPIPPDPIPDKVARDINGKPLVPLTYPGLSLPSPHPGAGEMSRANASDREGGLGGGSSPSTPLSPISESASSVPPHSSNAPSVPSSVLSVSSVVNAPPPSPAVKILQRPRAPWHPPLNTDRCNIGDARRDRPP